MEKKTTYWFISFFNTNSTTDLGFGSAFFVQNGVSGELNIAKAVKAIRNEDQKQKGVVILNYKKISEEAFKLNTEGEEQD